MSHNHIAVILLGVLVVPVGGCSDDGMEKVVVRGTVRYVEDPIPHGQIRFTPIEGTKGPISGAVIKDGKYVADGKGGVPLGKHRVEIYAYRPMERAPAAFQAEGGPSEQYLPGKFNGGSILTAVVTAESNSQPIDFNLVP